MATGMVDRVRGRAASLYGARGAAPGPPSMRDMSLSLDEWASYFSFGGLTYPLIQTTLGSVDKERIVGNAVAAMQGVSSIYALIQARVQLFAQIRFQWTRFSGAQPGDLFGTDDLKILEKPWPNGSTPRLLAKAEIDNSIGGNAYVARPRKDRLARLRPDLVTICLGSEYDMESPADAPDVEVAGYAYFPRSGRPQWFWPWEIAHYAPMPDPNFQFLGMSWMTPILREVQSDALMTEHKYRFFANAAPQSLDAKILTPAGWSTMGAMRLGGEVIGSDGKAHRVTGVFPRGEQPVYRVRFSDGAETECTADHLWTVASYYDRKRGVIRTLPLRDIIAGGIRYASGPAKWSVPLVEPVEYADPGPLPLHPYLLGALLGDGSFRSNGKGSGGVSLAAHAADAQEMAARLAPLLPPDVWINARDRDGWAEFYFRGLGGPLPNNLTVKVKELGLWDVRGQDKFIPAQYLRASVNDRIALLQGLIDTDGHVNGTLVRFTNTSRVLCEQLAELAGSLGGIASVFPAVKRDGKPQWSVTVKRLPAWINPARLFRKAEKYQAESPTVGRWRYIESAEEIGVKPVQCIRVDTPDSLYVTDGWILTHNTPNLAIKFDPQVPIEDVKAFKALVENEHRGAFNAWKTLYLGGGADPVPVGTNMRDLDFAITQGHGEARLAAAAGVPASWVGFSEGLQGSSLNASNFNAQRRRLVDGTLWHLWTEAAQSFEAICPPPDSHANLWFDARIPATREDAGDIATIQAQQAQTISTLVMQGFDPGSVTKAVVNNDMSLLKHTGALSVQLHKPGEGPALPAANGAKPKALAAAGNGSLTK